MVGNGPLLYGTQLVRYTTQSPMLVYNCIVMIFLGFLPNLLRAYTLPNLTKLLGFFIGVLFFKRKKTFIHDTVVRNVLFVHTDSI